MTFAQRGVQSVIGDWPLNSEKMYSIHSTLLHRNARCLGGNLTEHPATPLTHGMSAVSRPPPEYQLTNVRTARRRTEI